MADEALVEQTPEEIAAAAAEAAEEAEFAAGFDDKPTTEKPPAEDEAAAAKKAEDDAAAKATADAAAAAAAAVPEYVQITKAEWQALQAKSTEIDQIKADNRKELDRAFGKVGGLERTLSEIQKATPAGYTVEVTDDIVADLQEEFPELGGLTLKAFKSFAGKLKGTAPGKAEIDPKAIGDAVSAGITRLQEEALEEDHGDWRAIVGAPEDQTNQYRQWLAKQPAEYQKKLGSTNSAAVISKSITKFNEATAAEAATKATADAEVAKKAAAEQAKKDAALTRQQRLDAAATSKGAGGHAAAKSDDDEFNDGYNGR